MNWSSLSDLILAYDLDSVDKGSIISIFNVEEGLNINKSIKLFIFIIKSNRSIYYMKAYIIQDHIFIFFIP